MKKPVSAAHRLATEEQAALNKQAYDCLSAAPNLMAHLSARFEKPSMIARDRTGRVDEFATMRNCGAYEQHSYIKQMIELGKQGQ